MAVRLIDGNVLIEWFRPYLHTGEAIPADVVIEDIRSMPTLTPPNEPLTQADLDKMHFDRVWIDYGVSDDGEREGEDGVVLYGKLYSIDTLDGSAFEDLLLDATGHGDTLDNPSGNYTVYRRPPEGEEDSNV